MFVVHLTSCCQIFVVSAVFGRPFVKRFALCYRNVVCLSVCLSCLSATLVYCGQTVGCIKMKPGKMVGLGTGHIVLHGDPAPPPQKGHNPHSQFSAHVRCGQTARWINMPPGREVDLGPGHISPTESPRPLVGPLCTGMRLSISATAELLFVQLCTS